MALSYKARRRWALFILVIGIPIYIVVVLNILQWLGRPPFLVELLVYIVCGIAWALPFKAIFTGVGREDPDADRDRKDP